MKNLKKGLVVVAGLALLTIGLAGCSNSSDNSVKNIKDKGTLVMGTSADYAPFEFPIVKNGKKTVTGYDIFIAQQIAKDMGVKLKITNTEFPSLITDLKNKKVDIVLAGMVSTDERKKQVSFSDSYYKVENVLLVNKADENKYNSISDLKGLQVGAQQTTTQEQIAKKQIKNATTVTEANANSLTTELTQGKLAGVVLENEIADNYVKQYPEKYAIAKNVKLSTPESQQHINIAVRKDDKKLLKQVNKSVKELKSNGKMDTFLAKAQNLQAKYGK
ncbi:Amino acid ABC transporter solute-binding protein [Paucilactobacillus oligofermentans DSM 15707 = LMG 22743]|nr:transporter substrate-binding domain-containing protein [Paucilactobacillus oligofermentans]CUS25756.1 Amino acid ABC transporter solute-binding protein [Paucilactobacillus oligofermentans DSM 15707 = LMG 22743]